VSLLTLPLCVDGGGKPASELGRLPPVSASQAWLSGSFPDCHAVLGAAVGTQFQIISTSKAITTVSIAPSVWTVWVSMWGVYVTVYVVCLLEVAWQPKF